MKSVSNLVLVCLLLVSCSDSDSNEEEEIAAVVPTLTTATATNITNNSAVSGGNISSDGGAPIIQRGLCWSIEENPTIGDNRTLEDTVDANFTSTIESLNPETTYFVRAYASNSAGIAYGNQISFTTL